jgi:hypothetical protein
VENLDLNERSHSIQITLPTQSDNETMNEDEKEVTNEFTNEDEKEVTNEFTNEDEKEVTNEFKNEDEKELTNEFKNELVHNFDNLMSQIMSSNNQLGSSNITIVENPTNINRPSATSSDQSNYVNNTFIDAIRRAIMQSITGDSMNEENKNRYTFNTTAEDQKIPTSVVPYSGDPFRPPIAFETLADSHPLINEIRQNKLESFTFYKEILTNFDNWIRSAMQSTNTDTADFCKELDKTFGIYLLKFTRVMSNEQFNKMIQIMETDTFEEPQDNKKIREQLKTIIIAIKEGILNEIITVFDTPNCTCIRCST